MTSFFSAAYRFFAGRRCLLFGAVLLALALAAVAFRGVRMQEDVAALLPDDRSSVALDFRLLQEAPFARKVLIELRGDAGVDPELVLDGAERLAGALSPSFFRLTSAEASLQGAGFYSWLLGALPSLATPDDLKAVEGELGAEAVRRRLREAYATLLSPEGWALKGAVQRDPLSLRDLTLGKLRYLSVVPKMRVQRGHFVSEDGRSVLLVADTPVAMTDSAGAARLIGDFDRAGSTLPAGVRATLLSGHRYTLANAEAIKRDLYVVLSLSSVAVLAIYVGFLRSRWAVFVFLVPASVLVLASGFLAACYREVFAATVGFGGVLLGIADEYAMHVYFAFRRRTGPADATLGEVSRPVLFGGMVTLASFAVMFLSSLPGQRQLAVYSMTGILASLLVSLLVLPHLVPPGPEATRVDPAPSGRSPLRARRWVTAVWILFLCACGSQVGRLRFDGDIRALSLVPLKLRAAEAALQANWGDLRGRALVFAEGKDLESALRVNEKLFAFLRQRMAESDFVSLAPILPSEESRGANVRRWREFWSPERVARLRATLEREGRAFGFSTQAFAPFVEGLGEAGGGGTAALEGAGLGEAVGSMILKGAGVVRVLTLVPDTSQVLALLESPGRPAGLRVVSQTRFADEVSRAVGRDFSRYLAVTSVLVLLLVVAVFRRPAKVLLALVPVLTGLLATFGGMGLLGIPFNLFNIVATILIVGLCVDYGIYMVCKTTEPADHGGDRAVLVSGLTTLAGFGVLVLARHPAMNSLGVTVLLGVGAAIPAALFVIPALWAREG